VRGTDIVCLADLVELGFEVVLNGFVRAVNGIGERGRAMDGRGKLRLAIVFVLLRAERRTENGGGESGEVHIITQRTQKREEQEEGREDLSALS
jgi:hypothetical protein